MEDYELATQELSDLLQKSGISHACEPILDNIPEDMQWACQGGVYKVTITKNLVRKLTTHYGVAWGVLASWLLHDPKGKLVWANAKPWNPLSASLKDRKMALGGNNSIYHTELRETLLKEARKAYKPTITDVVSSLAMDCGVLDCGCFEDWCSEYGYDTDSRKAERIYNQCKDNTLQMLQVFGTDTLNQIRELSYRM